MTWTRWFLCGLVTALIPAASAQATFVPGRILVKFRSGVSDVRASRALGSVSARSRGQLLHTGVHVVELPAGNERAYLNVLRRHPDVEFAELDGIAPMAAITPNDPIYSYPNYEWYLSKISAPAAWNTSQGSGSVTIAILDTGVYGTHEDLVTKMVPGWNVVSNSANTGDVNGHGTLVAGSAASATNNGVGVASACWYCMIMPIVVADSNGTATYSNIAAGITWAADHGARVANVSFIISGSATVSSAAQYMAQSGGVVTASAGNAGAFDSSADNPYIVTVSATDANDALYSWSNTGNNVNVAAPGCDWTPQMGGGYAGPCGTSISAPIVAGVVGLMLSLKPSLTQAQVKSILQNSADDLGTPGWDPSYGWGRVNAARALSQTLGGSDTTAPSVAITSPAASATVSGSVAIQATASDNVGVTAVTLYVDNVQVAQFSGAPYTFNWNTASAANGSHTLKATAADAAGNAANSIVTVTVSNAVADTTVPVVSISAPGAGATVSGTVTIQAAASDNVGVKSVTFYVDGVSIGQLSGSPYNLSWNTATAADGAHTLKVTATDAAGNSASASEAVTVSNSLADTTPPVITITSPASGAVVNGNVSVFVTASDNVRVVKVELYVDGVKVATSTSAPWTTKWNAKPASRGSHNLQTRAYDAAGNIGQSAVVTVRR